MGTSSGAGSKPLPGQPAHHTGRTGDPQEEWRASPTQRRGRLGLPTPRVPTRQGAWRGRRGCTPVHHSPVRPVILTAEQLRNPFFLSLKLCRGKAVPGDQAAADRARRVPEAMDLCPPASPCGESHDGPSPPADRGAHPCLRPGEGGRLGTCSLSGPPQPLPSRNWFPLRTQTGRRTQLLPRQLHEVMLWGKRLSKPGRCFPHLWAQLPGDLDRGRPDHGHRGRPDPGGQDHGGPDHGCQTMGAQTTRTQTVGARTMGPPHGHWSRMLRGLKPPCQLPEPSLTLTQLPMGEAAVAKSQVVLRIKSNSCDDGSGRSYSGTDLSVPHDCAGQAKAT